MKTIVFFTPKHLSNVGGGERVLAEVANALSQYYNVKVLTPYATNTYFQFNKNVEIINFGVSRDKSKVIRRICLVLMLYKLHKFIRKGQFDIFIAFATLGSALTLLSSSCVKDGNFYSWLHTSFFHRTNPIIKYIFMNRIHDFKKVIVLNKMDMEMYSKYHPNVITIPNLVAISSMQTSNLKQKKIVSVGRLSREKGFDNLIKICSKIFRCMPEWTLDIYGQDDGEKYNLQNLIVSENMNGRIRIFDPVRNIDKIYLSGSIFAFTSYFESFGLSLVEAGCYGLPVIAFDSPSGIKDIIHNNENGYLIDWSNYNDYERKLVMLMNSYKLRVHMGDLGKRYSQRYNVDSIINMWKAVL